MLHSRDCPAWLLVLGVMLHFRICTASRRVARKLNLDARMNADVPRGTCSVTCAVRLYQYSILKFIIVISIVREQATTRAPRDGDDTPSRMRYLRRLAR